MEQQINIPCFANKTSFQEVENGMCHLHDREEEYKAVKFCVNGNPYARDIIRLTNALTEVNHANDDLSNKKNKFANNIRASLGMKDNDTVLFSDDEKLILHVKFYMQRPLEHFVCGQLKHEHKNDMVTEQGDVNKYLKFVREAMIGTIFNSDECITYTESLILFSNQHNGSTQVLLVKATDNLIQKYLNRMDEYF